MVIASQAIRQAVNESTVRVGNLFPGRDRSWIRRSTTKVTRQRERSAQASQRTLQHRSSRLFGFFFVGNAFGDAIFEFLLGAAKVLGQLRQLGAAKENQQNNQDDEEFTGLQIRHPARLPLLRA